MDTLASSLGYLFKDKSLLTQALTHCSAGKDNNERLEFLGDAILGLIISDLLFQQYPQASEGELSRLRAGLVQQSTLAEIARSLQLGKHLVLGSGELKSGGFDRDSILADALEALISAVYIDAGLEQCQALVHAWFEAQLSVQLQSKAVKDAKTSLQEFLQARKLPLPDYSINEIKGQDHQQEFHILCSVVLLQDAVSGVGTSRKEAEQQAASQALELIGDMNE